MNAPCVWPLPKPAFACVKLHPNTILAFRKARGVRAKTDRIDAMLIARYLADARGRADLPATFLALTSACGRWPPGADSLSTPGRPKTAALIFLRAVRGVGPVVAATLIADLPELGRLSGKQIAALVGLAPHTHESGKRIQQAKTGHGRPLVRSALFNAARAAIRHPSTMRDFYNRIAHHNNRPGKVALTAVMRKILVIANAVARDHLKAQRQST